MHSPRIVAHRGLHTHHPENSLAAFRAAWDAGIAWCECDVHVTSDLVTAVVIHDETLDRTTDATGEVVETVWTRSSVDDIHLRDASGVITSETLPTLDQLVKLIPPSGGLLLEIKPHLHATAMGAVMGPIAGRNVVIQSFDPHNLVMASRFDRHVSTALLVETEAALHAALDMRWRTVYADHRLVDDVILRRFRRRDIALGAWTVNDPADMQRVIALGIETVITDDPLNPVWRRS